MEVSKLKNVVLVILVLLNLFLLVLSGGRRMQDARSREQARTAAVEVIRNGGVKLSDEIVPNEMNLTPRVSERNLEEEVLWARTLLGGDVTAQAKGSEGYYYANETGWLQVHNAGAYSAKLAPGLALGEQERPEEHAVALLARLDIQSRVVKNDVVSGQGEVLLEQTLDGIVLLDSLAVVRYENGRAVELFGNCRLPGSVEQVPGRPITVATALMRLYNGLNDMGDVYSTIKSITQAYEFRVEGLQSVHLTPVWQVETDTGSYRLDTLTGVLTRTGDFARQAPVEPAE